MKLILAIVRDDDANKVLDALTAHGFYVTKLPSMGGFLRIGNAMLLSGVEDDRVEQVMEIIQTHTASRPTTLIFTIAGGADKQGSCLCARTGAPGKALKTSAIT